MQDPIVLIGIGQIGGVLARGFLRRGHPVFPITRGMDMTQEAAALPRPALVLVTVAEADLHPVLEAVPAPWRERLGLVQNELLPRDWQRHGLTDPTVVSIWFEKKPGQDVRVIIPSPIFGPQAHLIETALQAVDIPACTLGQASELLYELVRKNLYILTTNIAGLVTGGTVSELWTQHHDLARQVADEIMDIQAWLTGEELPRERLFAGMLEAFAGDPQHKCTGRSAPARLQRALAHADAAELAVPKLREIAARLGL